MKYAYLEELFTRYPVLTGIREQIMDAYNILKSCYLERKTIYLAGNGGSCADAMHFAGELMKGFLKKRPVPSNVISEFKTFPEGEKLSQLLQEGVPVIALSNMVLTTAINNDIGSSMEFAQPLYVLGTKGDVYIGISTSGNSKNVYNAAVVAKVREMSVISFTGLTGGLLRCVSDVCIAVPEKNVFKVQELHLPVYHAICAQLEDELFD